MKDHSLARRIAQYGALLFFVQLAVGCTEPAAPVDGNRADANVARPAAQGEPEAERRLVVAFGDSLFAGYDLDQDEGFAPALERALGEQGVKARVVNAGVSGDTTAGGAQRLAFTLDGLPRKPDLVIVNLGGNDMLRGLDPAESRSNLDAVLTELDRRGIDAMLTGMLSSRNMGPDYERRFNAIYPALAEKHGVPLYPFILDGVIGRTDLMLRDGLHPNAQGVEIMASRVAPLAARAMAGES